MDETDRQILSLLAKNARISVTDIARKLGLARTTVQARLDRLENTGTIAGYTIRRGDNEGGRLYAAALLSIEPRSLPAVLSRLETLPEVEAVHTTAGRFDLMVMVAAESTEALDTVLDRIGAVKGVLGSESLIHLSTRFDRRTARR